MNLLWTYIDNKKWHSDTKYQVTTFILGCIFAMIGYTLWLIIRNWVLSTWDWMICFVGYPIAISWVVLFFYSVNHKFHNGIQGKS